MTAAEHFEFDKDSLGTAAEARIRALTKAINSNAGAVSGAVQVGGYTDKFGSREYNLDLSKRRAGTAAKILNERLAEKVTVSVTGHGETHATQDDSPATDENIARLAKDRKVVITVPLKAIPPEWGDSATFGPGSLAQRAFRSHAAMAGHVGNDAAGQVGGLRGNQQREAQATAGMHSDWQAHNPSRAMASENPKIGTIPNPKVNKIGKFGGQEIFVDYDATKNIWAATCPNGEGKRVVVMTSPAGARITKENFSSKFKNGGGEAAVSQLSNTGMDPSEALKLVLRGYDDVMGYFNGGSPKSRVSNIPPERRAEPASSSYPSVLCRLKGMDVTQRRMENGHYVAEWGPKDGPKVVIFESNRPLTSRDFREGTKASKNLRDAAKHNDFRPVLPRASSN